MNSFEHINDVWNYLEKSKSADDLDKRILDIPKMWGSFTYEPIPNGVRVYNDYYDGDDVTSDVVDIIFEEEEK